MLFFFFICRNHVTTSREYLFRYNYARTFSMSIVYFVYSIEEQSTEETDMVQRRKRRSLEEVPERNSKRTTTRKGSNHGSVGQRTCAGGANMDECERLLAKPYEKALKLSPSGQFTNILKEFLCFYKHL